MKKLILVFLLALVIAVAIVQPQVLYAQSDAGFLDSVIAIDNPAAWSGSAWYCTQPVMIWDPFFEEYYPGRHIVAGPFSQYPPCENY